jgi:hypothetical protein
MQNVTKMTFVNGVVVTVTMVNGELQWWMVIYVIGIVSSWC